jgi:hypothetical protein
MDAVAVEVAENTRPVTSPAMTALPETPRRVPGDVVPTPKLPVESILKRSDPLVEPVMMLAPVADSASVPALVTDGVVICVVNVGDELKTSTPPAPVSSVMSAPSSEEVSIEVLPTLLLKMVQSDEAR